MRPDANQVGDIVEVGRLGQRFHARVAGNASGAYRSSRLDRRIQLRELSSR
jgi:hypothetical protein